VKGEEFMSWQQHVGDNCGSKEMLNEWILSCNSLLLRRTSMFQSLNDDSSFQVGKDVCKEEGFEFFFINESRKRFSDRLVLHLEIWEVLNQIVHLFTFEMILKCNIRNEIFVGEELLDQMHWRVSGVDS
jgi:hypothetical protein